MSSASYDYGPAADRARKLLERRSRKRWRLWLAVAAVALVPVVAGYVAWTSYRGAEAKAAALAEQLGGRVAWASQRPRERAFWLSFAGTRLQDSQLQRFKPWWWCFPHLQDLSLAGTAITDEGLEHLSGTRIRSLRLDGTTITSEGLRSLLGCSMLNSLELSNTQVDDAGVAHLVALPGLRALFLEGTPITDAALVHLAAMPSLQYVRLGDNRDVTEAGVARLEQELPDLKLTRQ